MYHNSQQLIYFTSSIIVKIKSFSSISSGTFSDLRREGFIVPLPLADEFFGLLLEEPSGIPSCVAESDEHAVGPGVGTMLEIHMGLNPKQLELWKMFFCFSFKDPWSSDPWDGWSGISTDPFTP